MCSFNSSQSHTFALCHTSPPASWSFPGKLSQLQGDQDAFEQDISEHVITRAEQSQCVRTNNANHNPNWC